MLESFIDENREQMVETLQDLLRIKSLKGSYIPGQPFGEGPDTALKYVLNLASQHGLSVANVDGYAGHVEYGDGEDYVAVLAHLDVVPASGQWTYPPFGAEIHDNRVYARGAIDDKGPAMSVLWSLIGLKQAGIQPKRKIRLIFGIDEESDWKCMEKYFSTYPAPLGGFTPDADFPLIHAEKGVATLRIEAPAEANPMNPYVVAFDGGERDNMVPDEAVAIVECHSEIAASEWQQKLQKEARTRGIELTINSSASRLELTVRGVSAHGSTPDDGINAIVGLGSLLATQPVSNASLWRAIAGMDTRGRSLGIEASDDVTGPLTSNLGRGYLEDGVFVFLINIRYPIHLTGDELLHQAEAFLSDKWKVELKGDLAPLYLPLDHPVVTVLSNVYERATGTPAKPITIGGATYARAIPNGVAFGALFPGEPDLAHQADESWAIDDYFRCIEIYAEAMLELANTL